MSRRPKKLRGKELDDAISRSRRARERYIEERDKKVAQGARIINGSVSQRKTQKNELPVNHEEKKRLTIRYKHFVVWGNTFRHRHSNHIVEDIDATINLINNKGDVFERTVPGAHCKTCNAFFLTEAVYRELQRSGTLICRLIDEITYYDKSKLNNMQLARESLLKQYGYSVSKADNLSENRRRQILAILVDSKVLTRQTLIGYLDFFINMRIGQPKYIDAISKWKADRAFLYEYRTGLFPQYGISSIHRR